MASVTPADPFEPDEPGIVTEAASAGTQLAYRVNVGTPQCHSLEAG